MRTRERGRTLVIGGGGFIGRHVVSALADVGADVAVMDFVGPHDGHRATGWVTGSTADETLVASAVDGCEAVVFLANASLPGSSRGNLAREVDGHVSATLRVAEACANMGVERFVFASSGGTVYGGDAPPEGLSEDGPTRPRTAYGVSKLAVEHYLRVLGEEGRLRTLSLRIANPYGEGQRALRAQGVVAAAMRHAHAGTVMPIWGDGSVERDFVHVADVARAFVAGLDHQGPSHSINVGSARATSVDDVLEGVRRATGRELAVDYRPSRRIDAGRNVLRIDRAVDELGWRPAIGLDEGLARTASWWARMGADRS